MSTSLNTMLLPLLLAVLIKKQPNVKANDASQDIGGDLLKRLLGALSTASEKTDIAAIPAQAATAVAPKATLASVDLPKADKQEEIIKPVTQAVEQKTEAVAAAVADAAPQKLAPLPKGLQHHVSLLENGIILKKFPKSDTRDKVMKTLADIKSGVRLEDALSALDVDSKTMLANAIAGWGIEPPEQLNEFVSEPFKKYTNSNVVDCALKNVEVYYSGLDKGLSSSQAYNATEDHTVWKF